VGPPLPAGVVPDKNLVVIARDDDVSFGILQSRIHRVWALRVGTRLEDRPRYTSTTTFRTFPFPQGATPNLPPTHYKNPAAERIAKAAQELTKLRDTWLNPPELVTRMPEVVVGYPDRVVPLDAAAGQQLNERTLTKLYNENPPWLRHAHRNLDEAVAAAYGWEWPLADDDILKRLFQLNQQRGGL
jgi:type II restriction/modification system DNA methylase subunit YeeA